MDDYKKKSAPDRNGLFLTAMGSPSELSTVDSSGQESTFSGRDEAIQDQNYDEESNAHNDGDLAEDLVPPAGFALG